MSEAVAVDLDKRIAYWRKREAAARRAGWEEEAQMCAEIARMLADLRRETRRVEGRIDELVDAMPVEMRGAAE
jgi:hypothetical protein